MGIMGQNLVLWGFIIDIDDEFLKFVVGVIINQWYNGEVGSFNGVYGFVDLFFSFFFGVFGYFIQVVWKDIQKVGCVIVKCGVGIVFGM